MNFRKLKTLLLITAGILALASCKDDDDTVSIPSMNGSLSFYVDNFVAPGQVVEMTPSGLRHPDGKPIGYCWKVTPDMEKYDTTRFRNGLSHDGKETDGSFTYKFRDSLATYSVICCGFAEGYRSADRYKYVTVVKPGLDGSITGTGIKADDSKITASGIDYYYISHNGLDWMRNNLADPAYGVPYSNADAASNVFGRYYSHEEAVKACPKGWRLPTDREWRELASSLNPESASDTYGVIPGIAADLMADAELNLVTMWEYWPEVGDITNKGGISIIPAGYANLGEQMEGKYPNAAFYGLLEYAAFWTAETVEGEEGMAYYRYLFCDQPDMNIGKGDVKTFGASVRCVRESL